ncbi:MAG TPA: secondary thiamine-phosphate synthase enzyme YjbQ [Accumulibacter sp.]|jgi:secondary thiamine-phosphate synthase enzyme|nr:secondary thiamine-phosphate synthase enzyme YjbQ [Accumulibacter sp.]HQC81204.1 secondary thiamine-phosphate synthase enzyme YjbQ [Accumulibacter sp.]
MVVQREFDVHTRARGTVEITADVAGIVRDAGIGVGVVNVFVRHSSCSVVLTENADPAVRRDLETLAARWAPDGDPAYRHDEEGDDDMAAHGRAILAGATLTVPVADGRMRLGTWQGLYLWEHRTMAHRRRVVVTVLG